MAKSRVIRAAAVLVGVISFAAANPFGSIPVDTLISLQRGACERRCAVYKVVLFADGTGVLIAQYYVKRSGAFNIRVPVSGLRELLESAASANFFEMHNEYGAGTAGCPGADNDAPISIITISAAGRANTIVHRQGCGGGDGAKLTSLESEIDRLIQAKRFLALSFAGKFH